MQDVGRKWGAAPYLKLFVWTTGCILLLTLAQFGSIHLLNVRPSSWLFEASLDLAPPLLFAGDIAQLVLSKNPQAATHDQITGLCIGIFTNVALYSIIGSGVLWIFLSKPVQNGQERIVSDDSSSA